MINRITICADGHMLPESDCLGRTGEHNATVLKFDFFKDLNGKSVSDFRKELVAVNSQGSFRNELATNDFPIPSELTTDTELSLQVKLYKDDELVFKSNPHIFILSDSIDDSGKNAVQSVVDKAKESCRADLETSLETATGENHDNKTWEELNETVATLPIISEEQTQALGDWDLIKEYFKNYTGSSHHLFSAAPKDADGNNIPYRLPYIYTPKMKWNASSSAFSTSLLEVGIDVSSAQTIGSATATRPFTSQTLERLIMTGNANATTLRNFMYNASALQYIKLETPSEDVLTANPSYYGWAFYCCEKLQTIDCELDFTGQTDTKNMFVNCYKLKNLRIKPFTLSTSLSFAQARSLHNNDKGDYDSLISILNAITFDREVAQNITITFSSEITDFTQGMYQFWMKNVYFYESDGLYHSEPPKVTEDDVYLETTLYEAFTNKGVTIAWV